MFGFYSDLHEHFKTKTTGHLIIGQKNNIDSILIKAIKCFEQIAKKAEEILIGIDPSYKPYEERKSLHYNSLILQSPPRGKLDRSYSHQIPNIEDCDDGLFHSARRNSIEKDAEKANKSLPSKFNQRHSFIAPEHNGLMEIPEANEETKIPSSFAKDNIELAKECNIKIQIDEPHSEFLQGVEWNEDLKINGIFI